MMLSAGVRTLVQVDDQKNRKQDEQYRAQEEVASPGFPVAAFKFDREPAGVSP